MTIQRKLLQVNNIKRNNNPFITNNTTMIMINDDDDDDDDDDDEYDCYCCCYLFISLLDSNHRNPTTQPQEWLHSRFVLIIMLAEQPT